MRTIKHIKPGDPTLAVQYVAVGDKAKREVTATGPMPKEGRLVDALAAMPKYVPGLFNLVPYLSKVKAADLVASLSLNSVVLDEHAKKGDSIVISCKIAGEHTNAAANFNTPICYLNGSDDFVEDLGRARAELVAAAEEWLDALPPEAEQLSFQETLDGADQEETPGDKDQDAPTDDREGTQDVTEPGDGGGGTDGWEIVAPADDTEPAAWGCPECGDTFDTEELLDEHQEKEHPVAVSTHP